MEVQTTRKTESKKKEEVIQKSNKEMLNSINLIIRSDSDLNFTENSDSDVDDPEYEII